MHQHASAVEVGVYRENLKSDAGVLTRPYGRRGGDQPDHQDGTPTA
jgi:hypothetical protein